MSTAAATIRPSDEVSSKSPARQTGRRSRTASRAASPRRRRGSRARVRPRRDRTPGSAPERVGRLDPRGPERGEHPGDQTRPPGRAPEPARTTSGASTGVQSRTTAAPTTTATPRLDPTQTADSAEDRGLDEELRADVPAARAERAAQPDLVDALHDRDEHRVRDAEGAEQHGHRGERRARARRGRWPTDWPSACGSGGASTRAAFAGGPGRRRGGCGAATTVAAPSSVSTSTGPAPLVGAPGSRPTPRAPAGGQERPRAAGRARAGRRRRCRPR